MAWAGGQRRRGSALVTTIEPIHGPNMTTSRPGVCTNLCVCVCYCVCVCVGPELSVGGSALPGNHKDVTSLTALLGSKSNERVSFLGFCLSVHFCSRCYRPSRSVTGSACSTKKKTKNQSRRQEKRRVRHESRETFGFRFVSFFFFWRRIKMPAPIAILSLD